MYDELDNYVVLSNFDVYNASVVNYAILCIVEKYLNGYIDKFQMEKYIDIVYGYEFAYSDGLISLDLLYEHLREVIGSKILKVHKYDCNKFGFNDSESDGT